jgi:hypothetical protein
MLGTAAWRYPTQGWLTLCLCSHLGNIQGVLDLLGNGFDITAPVRAQADTTATLE